MDLRIKSQRRRNKRLGRKIEFKAVLQLHIGTILSTLYNYCNDYVSNSIARTLRLTPSLPSLAMQ